MKYVVILNEGDGAVGIYNNRIDAEAAMLAIATNDGVIKKDMPVPEALHYLAEKYMAYSYSILPITSLDKYIKNNRLAFEEIA